MTAIRQKGDRHRYDVRDADCLGMPCLRLHPVAVRGATASGSRSTGRFAYECGQRAHHGCPHPRPRFDASLASERRARGMKVEKA